jgi:hypothetical protein
MKNLIMIFGILLIISTRIIGQTTKPLVDYKGHILYNNKQIGSLNSTGSFDKAGKSVLKINGDGNVVDASGKVKGKAPKGGSFIYYFNDKPETFTIGKPSHEGLCEVKNSKGETVMLLHNNYKAQSACAVHCLYENHCMPK